MDINLVQEFIQGAGQSLTSESMVWRIAGGLVAVALTNSKKAGLGTFGALTVLNAIPMLAIFALNANGVTNIQPVEGLTDVNTLGWGVSNLVLGGACLGLALKK
ncbi:MAG: hypothetical protein CMH30_00200 [Micavibrio sp.]|nr:hypothetical protein [Micavibrio sp.]|tara:strand:- start:1430 stop:1741 length:312 start_codon:yes stop_codon:yes gene_type:complete